MHPRGVCPAARGVHPSPGSASPATESSSAEEKIGSISATLSLAPAPAVGLSMLSTTFTVVLNMLGGCPAARMGFQELCLIPGRHHHHHM